MRPRSVSLSLLAVLLLATGSLQARQTPPAADATSVVGVRQLQLTPQYWIDRLPQAQQQVLSADAIAEQNGRLARMDGSVHDLEGLPAHFSQADVHDWIDRISKPPKRELFDEHGQPLARSQLDAILANAALDAIPAQTDAIYGLVVKRADLRAFPTAQRVFSSPDGTDIDRFQESALFPGTPVVVLHESRDRQWSFVISPLYAAWMRSEYIARGEREQVLAYPRQSPAVVVTGATVHTVHTPEQPGVSELQLDMGVRVPLIDDWPAENPVNGQLAYTSYVIRLPIRDADGRLQLVPALLPRTADVSTHYLPLTQANLISQGFKFLGERYGWGHSYNTRDCSGFVSEVYRSFGVTLPRNTSDQGVSPALNRIAFDENTSHAQRMQAIADLQVGDLIYIPGHVMMVIGKENGMTYLIHDTTGISFRDNDGNVVRRPLNAVSVTPLEPLLYNSKDSFIDHIYSIQRIRR
ncbi:SH3 domain-containing protein [Pseudoxanthomonas dokdonensis]|uniref:NlpC-P60 family protein n=1 Tax=Pseudoxanthomonas dokdonensis TaxID=344882 RepID=A0A0R0CQ20_9GAMM|nr:SH3 domain-containing protein [Pseudoxanthomonas dokdonensis]KRG71967.1 NlpC-P60 family protein [Pseudoxanthomonas dokdonensis]